MSLSLPSAKDWAATCRDDGEFALASRFWNGGLTLNVGDVELALTLADGVVSPGKAQNDDGVIVFGGTEAVWGKVLAATPPRFFNDVMSNMAMDQGLTQTSSGVINAQYYAAAIRAIELLRPRRDETAVSPKESGVTPRFDAPVGRYVHVELDGHDHRIYFEESGQGIPLLLQHTAGCHGSQWRHLFEVPEITNHFRLIAYDLPYHGKSVPPVTREWWAERYNLEGAFLRSVPLALTEVLALERPAFMGCSVGGLLALDLAYRHADTFRAVVSVEGALNIEGDMASFNDLWHPQVSNEYKARLMDGVMSPTSPLPYRKETSFIYACGWPPVFVGDLYYYVEDFDLRSVAGKIDTSQVGVHILSGEYDYSGTVELGREAHETIRGSTWAEMKGVGHFPMSENPEAFIEYLLPILANIRG